MVGTYSAFLVLAPVLVDRDLLLLAFACGFPVVLVCIAYLIYMLRVLFSKTRRPRETDTRNTLLASAAMCAMWVGGAIVFLFVRGT